MNKLNDFLVQAEVAQTAYGTFSKGAILPILLTGEDVEMSISQAAAFVETWQVADQYIDPVTGVSATVFEAKNGGAKYLAIRGTELEAKDILADGILASAIPPIINPQFTALQLKLNAWLNDPNVLQGQNFTVTGHSLGGYLAAAVKQSYAQATEAYLYNAPGLGSFSGSFVNTVLDWMGLAPTYDQSKISNIIATAGISPIASLGFEAAPPINILIEDQTASDITGAPAAFNHSQQVLTDALAVYSSYSQLLPDTSIEQISKLISGNAALSINPDDVLDVLFYVDGGDVVRFYTWNALRRVVIRDARVSWITL